MGMRWEIPLIPTQQFLYEVKKVSKKEKKSSVLELVLVSISNAIFGIKFKLFFSFSHLFSVFENEKIERRRKWKWMLIGVRVTLLLLISGGATFRNRTTWWRTTALRRFISHSHTRDFILLLLVLCMYMLYLHRS